MRVCHITTVHPAKDARIFYRMCRGLAARRIEVVEIAPGRFGAEPCLQPSEWNDAIAKASRPLRAVLALRAAVAEHAQVYHFHDPEFIPMALALKLLKPDSAVVYDVHEDYPSMMRDKYWLPPWLRPALSLGMRWANRVAGRWLDGIVVADPGVAAEFAAITPGKIFVYYNFPSLSLFGRPPAAQSKAEVDLIYVGGLSERAGIFVLFDALEILARSGIKPTVRLAGYTDGEEGLAAVNAALKRRGLCDQVAFHGRLPHDQVSDWLVTGRIGLVSLQAIPKFMKNIPSKMFEYWACGLPVLASDLPPARKFLVDGKNGYLFSPASAAQLSERISFMLSNPERCRSLGRAGQRTVRGEWNSESQIDALIQFYQALGHKRLHPSHPTAARRPIDLPEH